MHHKQAELREAYEDHVNFDYTKFGSVRVDVLDEDRQRAADMANFIASEVDSVWNTMQMERASIGVRLVESKLQEAERNVTYLNDSLGRIRAAGVQDYHTQSERYNEYMGAAIVKGDDRADQECSTRSSRCSRNMEEPTSRCRADWTMNCGA